MPVAPTHHAPSSALPPGFVSARIVERRPLTPEIELFRIRLAAGSGAPRPRTAAGSHLEFLLALTSGDEIRHYSICEAEGDDFTIAVLREPNGRGGSAQMHAELVPGSELRVRGPRNTFPFRAGGPVYFVAGGIGITPFLSMIAEAQEQGIDWHLLYLGKARELMAYAEQLVEHGERVTLWESRASGRADLLAAIGALPRETTIYACGPDALQQGLRSATAATGHVVVIEDFDSGKSPEELAQRDPAGASGDTGDTGPVSADGRPSLPFTVELADGSEIDVSANESILDALNTAGFRALSSCKRGTCGTCETPILEGEADHRDSVLSAEERAANESMMICVSRACGERIVLDL